MFKAIAASAQGVKPQRTPLTREQIGGFWAVYSGWVLDGVDSVIYALVLIPALTELLPASGIAAPPATSACTARSCSHCFWSAGDYRSYGGRWRIASAGSRRWPRAF